MKREELLDALRRMAPETGSLNCLGCRYEHGCATHGCAIIRVAIVEINMLANLNMALRDQTEEMRRAAMTPQSAIEILRNANFDAQLRVAADMAIEALEREMGGKDATI